MPCPRQTGTTGSFWSRRGIAADAVTAYEAARIQLRNQARRWADDAKARKLRCPEGCAGPRDFRWSLEELATRGHYSRGTGLNYFQVEGRIHWSYACDPVAPPPEAGELPGKDLTDWQPAEPGGDVRDADGPDSTPCRVSITLHDGSQRVGQGVFDWDLDVRLEATASNPTHAWPPSGLRITEVTFMTGAGSGGRLGHSDLDRIINAVDDLVSQGLGLHKDLTARRYGLAVTSGPGVATVRGLLRRDVHRLALDAASGPSIRIRAEAVDEAGDRHVQTFVISPR